MNQRTWWQRLTSRPFMATVAGAVTALGACVAAWQTAGIPVDDKVDLTIAAITAVSGVVAMFTHAETAKDKAAIVAGQQFPTASGVHLDDAGEVASQ